MQLDAEITAQIQAEHAVLPARLQKEPSIGATAAAVLLAELPSLGQIGRRPLTATVDVAPLNRSARHIGNGRSRLRCRLWMATLVAVRHHPKLRAVLSDAACGKRR